MPEQFTDVFSGLNIRANIFVVNHDHSPSYKSNCEISALPKCINN